MTDPHANTPDPAAAPAPLPMPPPTAADETPPRPARNWRQPLLIFGGFAMAALIVWLLAWGSRLQQEAEEAKNATKYSEGERRKLVEEVQNLQRYIDLNYENSGMARLAAAQTAAAQQAAAQLQTTLRDQLADLQRSGVEVVNRNGTAYLLLPEALLFPAGGVAVSPRGDSALARIAEVLLPQPTLMRCMVEGHTDNQPAPQGSDALDTWDLSARRATAVTRALIAHGMSPRQLVAAGRGEFSPLGPNDTDAQRAQNRRTEIALIPR